MTVRELRRKSGTFSAQFRMLVLRVVEQTVHALAKRDSTIAANVPLHHNDCPRTRLRSAMSSRNTLIDSTIFSN